MAVPDEHAAALAAAGIAASALQPTARVLADSPSVQWLRQQYQDTGLYAWSRRRFAAPGPRAPQYQHQHQHHHPQQSLALSSSSSSPAGGGDEDPLSLEGQLRLYRRTRNRWALREAEALAHKCAAVLGVGAAEEEDPDGYLLDGLDALLSSKQRQQAQAQQAQQAQQRKQRQQGLRLQQKAVFESDAEMTSQLLFHPFEPLLVSTDDHARVRVWHYEEGRRLGAFKNETAAATGGIGGSAGGGLGGGGGGGGVLGSPAGTAGSRAARITSVGWLNEATTSHLLTGSDDGVVRVWGGVVGVGTPWAPPRLVTAFYAHALAGRGSGLVTKWAHGAGLLLTGGSSDRLRAWDLRREQCVREWGTGGEAAVTCLAASTPPLPPQAGANFSARGMLPLAPGASGGGGGGGGAGMPGAPSLVVAGFGDGKAKLFDLRADRDAPVATLAEHAHWLVLADFVKGGRELLTGSLAGEVRFWDLRRTGASLRTVDVGKGPMTAMATHRTCPLMASGSYNQFIKVLTLEGDTLTVIRYHDGILGQRIGPVATLAFHPCRLLMAAGAADSLISIYHGHFPGQQ